MADFCAIFKQILNFLFEIFCKDPDPDDKDEDDKKKNESKEMKK